MARSYDWSPLDIYDDPIPGSPSTLRDEAKKFRAVADSIANTATQLRSLARASNSVGEFADEFKVQAEEVADRITKAKKRYKGFAEALNDYATPLGKVQSDSVAALNRAITARSNISSAAALEKQWRKELEEPDLSAADIKHYQKLLDKATNDRVEAESEIYYAKNDLQDVIYERDSEAQKAANAISKVGEDSGINDTGWDNWVQFWEENGEWIDTVVTIIGYVAAAFVIIALFVPGLNILVGGVIGLVMLVSVIAAGLTILNAVCQASAGTKSVNQAVIEVGLALLPFGIGKLASPGAKAGEQLLGEAIEAGSRTVVASSAAQGVEGVTRSVAAEAIEAALANRVGDLAKLQELARLGLTVSDGVGPTVRALLGTKVGEMVMAEVMKEGGWFFLEQAIDQIELPNPWVLEQQTSW